MKRTTRQREVIREVLAGAGRPLSPLEVLEGGQARLPNLGMATVYRTLNLLTEEGIIKPVEVPGHASRYYESTDLAQHDHFYCNRCQRVFDVDRPAAPPASPVPRDFAVESTETVYSGRCPTCRDPSRQ